MNAYSRDWYASLGLQYGVTLNLTVQGANSFYGHNHPGVKATEFYEGASNPQLNLILEENSSITFGDAYDWIFAIDANLTINMNEGTECSANLNSESWRENGRIDYTNGTGTAHKTQSYYYIDDETCEYRCDDCTDIEYGKFTHDKVLTSLAEGDPEADTKHGTVCLNCSHVFEKQDHNLEFIFINEESHGSRCKDCQYVITSTKDAHTVDETNTCTGCGESYTASYTLNGETKYYFDFRILLDSLGSKGGEVKLLKNYTGERIAISTPYGENVNITIDLNGFRLEKVRFSNRGIGKITIIDTSEAKTGVYKNDTGVTSSNNGTMEYVGITIEMESVCADRGTVTFKDVTVTKFELQLYVRENDAKVELTNVKAQNGLWIRFETNEYNSNVSISGGEFSNVVLDCGSYHGTDEINLIDTLAQGYAFADDNGIINGYTKVMGTVKVIEHNEHEFDVYSDLGATHIVSCICGYTEEGSTGENHTLGENGTCVCDIQINAVVNDELYFGKVSSALKYVDNLGGGTVKLINNAVLDAVTIDVDATLDLNGCGLSANGEIDLNGKFTVCDSSKEQSGKMSVSETSQSSYLFDVHPTGILVINGGEISGENYFYGYEDEIPYLEVNGGKFVGGGLFYIHNNVNAVINDGHFEESSVFYIFYPNRPCTLAIYGGTFVNCVIVNENGVDPQNLLGTIEGCELGYLDAYGNAVTLEMGQEYEGVLTVAHKNSTLVGSESGHSFFCETCNVTLGLVDHLDLEYTADENDATQHIVICGACNYETGTEAHSGEATCTEKATCELCETPYGEPLGHSWTDADCVTPKTCSVCDETEGEALGHTWVDADCVTPKTCSVCDETEGEALGHSWVDANCTTVKTCSVCKVTEGKALGHNYGDDGKCTVCGKIDPNYQPEEGLSTGAIVGIVIGSVAVLGGLGVGAWFIWKKKRV